MSIVNDLGRVIATEARSLWLQGVGEDHGNGLPHIGLDCWSPVSEICTLLDNGSDVILVAHSAALPSICTYICLTLCFWGHISLCV